MCGFLCIADRREEVAPDLATELRDRMVHRGPDAGGVNRFAGGHVVLAHRRLSILDLSEAANQPMSYRGLWITYNGEIYNYRELRARLTSLGHSFRTLSDTEVLLASWSEWGVACLDQLEGMFAFALYEEATGQIHLVRDRLGIKPAFYYHDGELFVAASELRAVVGHPRVESDLDYLALDEYLTYRYVPPPRTIWRGVSKLPPGHRLVVQDGRVTIHRWWDVEIATEGETGPVAEKKAKEELVGRIEDSVRAYLASDVPVGVFLSGGWDSSVVTHFAARHHAGELHAFSIGFDVALHSELELARIAARHHGVIGHEEVVDAARGVQVLDRLVDLFEEPWTASAAIPMLEVARLARRDVTVGLSGDGGDEIFGGYRWYPRWLAMQRPGFWKTRPGRALERGFYRLEGVHRDSRWLPGLEPLEQYAQLHGAIHASDKARLLGEGAREAIGDHDSLHYFRRYWREDLPPFSRMQYLDLKTFLPEMCLSKVDRTSMASSLEARTPLLDHTLVESVFRLPEELRNPRGALKALFKSAVAECVPPAIRAGSDR